MGHTKTEMRTCWRGGAGRNPLPDGGEPHDRDAYEGGCDTGAGWTATTTAENWSVCNANVKRLR